STLPASQPPPPIEVTTSRRERREREREREPEGSRQHQIRDALDRLKAVDWAAVQHLRSQVSAALTLVSEDTALDESRHRTTVTRLTTQALDDWTQDRIARGEGVVSLDTQAALRGAVLDSM